jgi:hypothetical protein
MAQIGGNGFGQWPIAVARDEFHFALPSFPHRHTQGDPCPLGSLYNNRATGLPTVLWARSTGKHQLMRIG